VQTIVLRSISKFYPTSGVQANDGATLCLTRGTIHAVVGENGAGKTTLMRILAGQEHPDSGSILIDDKPVVFKTPAVAGQYGIGMVHQHPLIIPDFTVEQNIVFGFEPRKINILVDEEIVRSKVVALCRELGFDLEPSAPVGSLGAGAHQQIEILRQIFRNREILILDEPTSVLAEQEIQSLFDVLRHLKARGFTILIITHKPREVLALADQITVMRHGKTVGEYDAGTVDETRLARLIMGTNLPDTTDSIDMTDTIGRSAKPEELSVQPELLNGRISARNFYTTKTLVTKTLEVDRISVRSRHSRTPQLEDVSFSICRGEVCGICALSGNGLELMEDVLGGFERPSSGNLRFCGKPYPIYPELRQPPWNPAGIAYVPSDRMRRGVCDRLSIEENFIALDRKRFFPHGFANRQVAREITQSMLEDFGVHIRAAGPIGELSGGTIQKTILARELSWPFAPLCILCDPSAGLDITSTDFLYARIAKMRARGSAIALLSSNLDEILTLSDRIIVLHRGRVAGDLQNDGNITKEKLGALMLGLGSADSSVVQGQRMSR